MPSTNEKKFKNITIESVMHVAESITSFQRKAMSCNTCSNLRLSIGGDLKCMKHKIVFAHNCDDDEHEYVSLYLSEFICDDYFR